MNSCDPDKQAVDPALVPNESEPRIIMEQPSSLHENETKQANLSRKTGRLQANARGDVTPTGIARLAVAQELLLETTCGLFSCELDRKYWIHDFSEGSQTLIFEAAEGWTCFYCGDLRNVVIRDRDDVPVARACFKEKYLFVNSLVLAVYSPPETLVGTIEESSNCWLLSSRFLLRNADGFNLFRVTYTVGLTSSQFMIQGCDNDEEVAKIVTKSRTKIHLKFLIKMSITSKLILLGFCVGLANKRMSHRQGDTDNEVQ